jgi:hypothetical protein
VPDGSRDKFVDFNDVSCIARVLDAETVHLDHQDGISVCIWVEKLKENNVLVFYKDKLDPAPPGLPVLEEHLILCIQTQYQLDAFRHLGLRFIGIDATHNTTTYPDLMLYMIIVCDDWGHSVQSF